MPSASEKIVLTWEDKEPRSLQWWLARAHQTVGGKRDFFIAEDTLAGYLIGIVRCPPAVRYKVIVAVPLSAAAVSSSIADEAKAAVARWIASGQRENIWRWRIARWSKLLWIELSTIAAGFSLGILLGLLVSFVATSSGLIGWQMIVVGGVIGAGSGPFLKFILDRHPKNTMNRPWVRFIAITLSAMFGAVLAVGIMFTLIWSA